MVIKRIVLIVWLFVSVSLGWGQFFSERFSAEPDVNYRVEYEKGMVVFSFQVPPNHHITDLKHGFFRIEVEKNAFIQLTDVKFPPGEPYADETVFRGKFEVNAFIQSLRKIIAPIKLKFIVRFQICQEKPDEVCLAPGYQEIELEIARDFSSPALAGKSVSQTKANQTPGESFSQKLEGTVKRELDKKSALLFLLVFVAGFLTSLTPCVYPVIPIVMGYIGTRSGGKKIKGFYLSLFFVMGMSLVYSLLGVVAAKTGSLIGITFQNPVVVIVIAVIFLAMGLSLAGLFSIPVPASLSSSAQKGYRHAILGSFFVGGISGIIAAPCVGPVLIALLSWISQTGNVILGFWLTFVFSLGLGVIFLLAGTFSGILSSLPRGGEWMAKVKHFFSIALIAGGIYFLTTITSQWTDFLLWGIFLIAVGVFSRIFDSLDDAGFKERLFRVLLVLVFLAGVFLFFKSLEMKYFPVSPEPSPVVQAKKIKWYTDLDRGKGVARAEKKMLMIDTYADWCVACKELEKYTFSHPDVSKVLSDFVLVKLDFTRSTEKNNELKKSLGIFGMPTIIFLDSQGTEIKRFSRFVDQKEFLRMVNRL